MQARSRLWSSKRRRRQVDKDDYEETATLDSRWLVVRVSPKNEFREASVTRARTYGESKRHDATRRPPRHQNPHAESINKEELPFRLVCRRSLKDSEKFI
ncbi:hypothetical protein ACOSQ4_032604 [Xanthoceras sorbifolium]